MSIWRWADWLDKTPPQSRVTLGEGNTPLVRSRRIGPAAGMNHLYLKLEISNPTGSYKDRFAAAAISHMIAAGQTRCVATSSGNTGSALAAYCAAANLQCHIAIVEPAPLGKLKQMMAYGAHIFRVRGFGIDRDITCDTFERLVTMGEQADSALQISAFKFSPVGMTGVQTISYELAEQSTQPIDHVFSPAGGGGLTLAVAQGFVLLVEKDKLAASPAIECVQPIGNNTIAGPLRDGADKAQAVQCTTDISGLQVPSVMDGDDVIKRCRASGGTGHLVHDDDVWLTQKRLAREEGIFCEPAGAVALAGALQAVAQGLVQPDATMVCLVTGSGFKDDASADRMIGDDACPLIGPQEVEQQLASSDAASH